MRIISQNGRYDVPYEQCIISARGGMISAEIPSTNSSTCSFLMGEYSSLEKVQKAIGMLHQFYDSNEFMKNCNSEETFKLMRGILSEKDFKKTTSSIFRFPADEEIEVEEC